MNDKESNKIVEVAKYYDNRAKNSNAIKAAGQWGSEKLVPEICKEIIKKINFRKENKILEIGCGSGILGNNLTDHCKLYVGTDISKEMLKKFFDISKTKPSLFQSISEVLPFSNNFFDVVIMNSVTMHFHQYNQLKNTLNEIQRVAKKDAIIFIGDNVTPSGSYWELSWFQNLNRIEQRVIKPYIKMRKWLAQKNTKFAGKWTEMHAEVNPKFIQEFFKGKGKVTVSESGASYIKNKKQGRYGKSSKRVDFLIQLKS